MIPRLLFLLALFCSTYSLQADNAHPNDADYTEALILMDQGDIPNAILLLKKAAKKQHPKALFSLGEMYEQGRGVEIDLEKAMAYYRESANLYFPPATQAIKILRKRMRDINNPVRRYVKDHYETENGEIETGTLPTFDTELRTGLWIQQQDPDAYTLQITSLQDFDQVDELIRQHDLRTKTAYYKFHQNGDTRYIVIYGVFNSKEAAESAASELPPTIRTEKHKVLSLRTIQKTITRQGLN